MRTVLRSIPCLLLLLPLAACSSAGATRAAPSAVAAPYEGLIEVWGDKERLEFSKAVQVGLPAKMAVADVSYAQGDYPDDQRNRDRRMVPLVEALGQDTVTYSDVMSLFRVGDAWGTGADLEHLRAVAARSQADLLLLVDRRERVDEGYNLLAPLNVLLLPMLFVPTQSDEVELTVRMAVVDVRNGLLYTTVEDLRSAEFTTTVAGEDDRVEEELDALFAASIEHLRGRLATKLRDLESQTEDR